jgi:hypothetical protein
MNFCSLNITAVHDPERVEAVYEVGSTRSLLFVRGKRDFNEIPLRTDQANRCLIVEGAADNWPIVLSREDVMVEVKSPRQIASFLAALDEESVARSAAGRAARSRISHNLLNRSRRESLHTVCLIFAQAAGSLLRHSCF